MREETATAAAAAAPGSLTAREQPVARCYHRVVTATLLSAPPIVASSFLADELDAVTVVDTRRVSDYLDGHVPGAVSLPLGALLVEDSSRAALRRLGAAARSALHARGVAAGDHVVLVDDSDGTASLGYFVCQLAGMQAVSVLHGGIRSWLHHGGTLDATPPAPATPGGPVVEVPDDVLFACVAPLEEVREAVGGNIRLVDTRSQLEHEGIVGPPCCLRRGHIAGSVHLEWTALLSPTGDLHGPDRIRQEAHHVGLSEEDEIVVYCHSGHRSAIACLALRAAGFSRTRNYLGSWHEWSQRDLPRGPEEHPASR